MSCPQSTNKKVSIIIPAFNEDQYLPLCLDSIFNIQYPKENFEVIVVDNGSTDHTMDIATGYGVKVLRDDSKNVSGLRNLGAVQASGEIIAFVDADCIVSRDWLKNASIYFDKKEIVAWGNTLAIQENATWVQKTWLSVTQKGTLVQDIDWLPTINLFVRRDQFLSLGGFNESLVTCEDVDLSYRLNEIGKIVSDNRIKVIHLREPSTVREFMKKEIWRGQGNLKGILSHGIVMKELPSLFIPLYFGVLMPLFLFVVFIAYQPALLILCAVLYLLPSMAVLFKVKGKRIGFVDILRLLFLIQVYFFSRTISAVKIQRSPKGRGIGS